MEAVEKRDDGPRVEAGRSSFFYILAYDAMMRRFLALFCT